MPALRNRPEDIPLLADHFLRRFAPTSTGIPAETIAYMQARLWPGNVRELRNALEHAAIIARSGTILPEHFPPPVSVTGAESNPERLAALIRDWVRERVQELKGNEPAGLYDELQHVIEPALLKEVFRLTEQNRLVSARWLGLARATLRKLMARYGIGDGAENGQDED